MTWMNNPTGHLDLECRGLDARERTRARLERAHAGERRWEDGTRTDFERGERWVRGGYRGMIAFLRRGGSRTRAADERRARDRGGGGGDGGDGGGRSSGKGGDVAAPVVGELYGFKILKMTSSGEQYKNIVVSGPIGGRTRRSGARRPSARRPRRACGGAPRTPRPWVRRARMRRVKE